MKPHAQFKMKRSTHMTTETKQPARMGRPELPPDEKTRPHTVYLTDAQWAKVQERGKDWLRALIDKAR